MRLILCFIVLIITTSCEKKLQAEAFIEEAPIKDSTLANAVIVCDGNSITWGKVWGVPYPQQLQETTPFDTNGAKIYNKGYSGISTPELIVKGSVDIDTLYNSTVRSILIVWEVTNDIAYNGDVDGAVDRIKEYCVARRLAGWQVVLIGVLPRIENTRLDAAAQLQRKIDEANIKIKKTWTAFADGFIDITQERRLTNAKDSRYYADGIHLTHEGMSIIKNLVIRKLKELK